MDLITLLIWVIIFAVAGYGLWWLCQKFAMPQPAMWICGGILIIILLLVISGQITLPHVTLGR